MPTDRERSYTTPSRGWAGWVAFAGITLALIGFFDILQGLTALFNDEYFTVRNGDLLVFDFTAWGWITLIWGVLLIAAGLGLLAGRGWARWFGIFVVFVNAIAADRVPRRVSDLVDDHHRARRVRALRADRALGRGEGRAGVNRVGSRGADEPRGALA